MLLKYRILGDGRHLREDSKTTQLRPRWLLGSALALALALWAAGLLDVAPPSPGNCTCSAPEPVYPFGPSSASVPDCCCAFGDLERSNAESVHPTARRAVSRRRRT